MRIWFDDDIGQIWIEGQDQPYPAGSLLASIEGDGKVGVRLLPSSPLDLIAKIAFGSVRDHDGAEFSSQAAAKAYLDNVFWRRGSGTAVVQEERAALALGGHRVVARGPGGIVYASADDPTTADMALGITLGAVDAGAVPQVVSAGLIREPSWAWAPGPVYLGLAGALTQSAPMRGTVLQIGIAPSATSIFVALQETFHLAA